MRISTFAIILATVVTTTTLSAQRVEHHVVILSHDVNDVRLPMTLEAVKFWNNTAKALDLGVRVTETVFIE